MRQSSDTGFSPNIRFDRAPKKKGTVMSAANIIRAYATYCKERKVEHSVIVIEGKPDMSYVLLDPDLVHKVNNEWVIVRRYDGDMSRIYLFDVKTDTFLGSVDARLDVAGDLASMTEKDEKQIAEHMIAKKRLAKYRQAKYEEALTVDADPLNIKLPEALTTARVDLSSEEGLEETPEITKKVSVPIVEEIEEIKAIVEEHQELVLIEK